MTEINADVSSLPPVGDFEELDRIERNSEDEAPPTPESISRVLERIRSIYDQLMHDLSQFEKEKMREKKDNALGTCGEAGAQEGKQGTVSLIQGCAALALRMMAIGMASETDQKMFEFLGGQFTEHVGGWVKSGYQSNATILQGKLRIITSELDQLSQSNMYTKGSKDKFAQLMQEVHAVNRQAYRG